jgi:hypothetical protein
VRIGVDERYYRDAQDVTLLERVEIHAAKLLC